MPNDMRTKAVRSWVPTVSATRRVVLHSLVTLLVAALGFAPRVAAACVLPPRPTGMPALPPPPPPAPDDTDLHWRVAIAGGGVVNGTVLVLQIVAGREMFPAWAAGLELALGLAQIGVGIGFVHAGAQPQDDCGPPPDDSAPYLLGAGGALIGFGGWLVAHAIWSFVDGDADMEVGGVALHPYAAPVAEGGLVGVVGVF